MFPFFQLATRPQPAPISVEQVTPLLNPKTHSVFSAPNSTGNGIQIYDKRTMTVIGEVGSAFREVPFVYGLSLDAEFSLFIDHGDFPLALMFVSKSDFDSSLELFKAVRFKKEDYSHIFRYSKVFHFSDDVTTLAKEFSTKLHSNGIECVINQNKTDIFFLQDGRVVGGAVEVPIGFRIDLTSQHLSLVKRFHKFLTQKELKQTPESMRDALNHILQDSRGGGYLSPFQKESRSASAALATPETFSNMGKIMGELFTDPRPVNWGYVSSKPRSTPPKESSMDLLEESLKKKPSCSNLPIPFVGKSEERMHSCVIPKTSPPEPVFLPVEDENKEE